MDVDGWDDERAAFWVMTSLTASFSTTPTRPSLVLRRYKLLPAGQSQATNLSVRLNGFRNTSHVKLIKINALTNRRMSEIGLHGCGNVMAYIRGISEWLGRVNKVEVTSASPLPVFRRSLEMHLFRRSFSATFVQCLRSDYCNY